MADFILFGTEGCHLCEDAALLLTTAGLEFQQAEIMARQEWQEKYQLKIPVLLHSQSGNMLDWPFDQQKLLVFYDSVR